MKTGFFGYIRRRHHFAMHPSIFSTYSKRFLISQGSILISLNIIDGFHKPTCIWSALFFRINCT